MNDKSGKEAGSPESPGLKAWMGPKRVLQDQSVRQFVMRKLTRDGGAFL